MSAMISTIQHYMYDQEIYSKPRKNFIKENMKRIKKLQLESRDREKTTKSVQQKKFATRKKLSKKGGGGGGGGDGNFIHYNDFIIDSQSKFDVPVTPETEVQTCLRLIDQGCQTLSDAKEAYNEGRILCSRGKPVTPPPPEGMKNISVQVAHSSKESEEELITPVNVPLKEDGKVDYVRLNALIPLKKKTFSEKRDPTKAPPNYQKGVLPKYLREAKKQQIEEVQEKGLVEIIDDEDSPGEEHVCLGEDEKKKHIKEMRKAYARLVTELNSIPMKSDSTKIKKRREEIEKALQSIEDGIKMFSRDNLYVKLT